MGGCRSRVARVVREVVAEGAPEEIARNPKSYTVAYLKPVLAKKGTKRSTAE